MALVLGYRCNCACTYCHVPKHDAVMPEIVARSALLLAANAEMEVRLSGAEPLLHPDILSLIADEADRLGLSLRLTTNGWLLDAAWLDFLERFPKLELVLSYDGSALDRQKQRPRSTVSTSVAAFPALLPRLAAWPHKLLINLVISPEDADTLCRRVADLWKQGFWHINLLPAYYIPWPSLALHTLETSLRQLARLSREARERSWPFSFVNGTRLSSLPLFLDALTVDVDGALYDNECFMHAAIYPTRAEYACGHIGDTNVLDSFPLRARHDWAAIQRRLLPCESLLSTTAVDELLSAFVAEIKLIGFNDA